ncbi:unnamed protein product [Didymodactylos carnosus]|uniref:Uncharacterized protein n=1 Tax=Didymodactylos carnosus TaxID=1234261 RepID=A0A8S2YG86_9BILA|nr:unnamed protein product [Didymodactylos carnosus]
MFTWMTVVFIISTFTPVAVTVAGVTDIEKAVLPKKLRTPKSIIHTIDERIGVEEPSQVYRLLVSSTEGVTTVNNSRQVENGRARHLAHFKLSIMLSYDTSFQVADAYVRYTVIWN